MRTDELRTALRERADRLDESPGLDVGQRLVAVRRRVAVAGRRRHATGLLAAAVLGVALVVGLVVVRPLLVTDVQTTVPPVEDMVQPPPRLAGQAIPDRVTVGGVDYLFWRGEETAVGGDILRVAVAEDSRPQAIAWATAPGSRGEVVVTIDGTEVSRDSAGRLHTGVLLTPGVTHLVAVRPTDLGASTLIGLAVYRR